MNTNKECLGKVAITVEKDYYNKYKSYDKLVIVEVQDVGCYISRKPVPELIDISNREYWIPLSIYSKPTNSNIVILQNLGDRADAVMSQKAVTKIINDLKNVISQYHPEAFSFNVFVNPKTIQRNIQTPVTVDVLTLDNTNAENITISVGELTRSYSNINNVHDIFVLSDTTDIVIKVTQNGITNVKSFIVNAIGTEPVSENKYMYFGGGQTYLDVYSNDDNKYDITDNIYGTYSVNIPNNGGYLYLIIPEDTTFNALNMLFDFVPRYINTVVLNDIRYKVYKESEEWASGTYDIKIK